MSLTYILIDYQNVQPTPAECGLIRGSQYRVWLFHGPNQNKVPMETADALQPLGPQVKYIKCQRDGKNALDFFIAFYLGRLVEEDKAASTSLEKCAFIIVSKDHGFDALFGHIESLGHEVRRVGNIREMLLPATEKDLAAPKMEAMSTAASKISAPKKAESAVKNTSSGKTQSKVETAKAATVPIKKLKPRPYERVIENLRDHPNNRPTTVVALERHLSTFLGKEASAEAVKALMQRLKREGVALANGKKIEYKISASKS